MNGGKREGAGVKEGSIRPKLTHYWSQDDIQEYFDWLKTEYKNNPTLAKMVGEQLMGKAPQTIQGPEDDTGKVQPVLVKIIGKDGDTDTN